MYDKHDAGSGDDDDDDDRTGWNINTSEAAGILLMMDMRENDKKSLTPQPESNPQRGPPTKPAKKFTDAHLESLSNIHVRGSQLTGSLD
jgi:hypothetical protein